MVEGEVKMGKGKTEIGGLIQDYMGDLCGSV